jgi:hypothetical protein
VSISDLNSLNITIAERCRESVRVTIIHHRVAVPSADHHITIAALRGVSAALWCVITVLLMSDPDGVPKLVDRDELNTLNAGALRA